MYKFDEDTVRLSGLKPCPVKVTLQTEKLYASVCDAAAKNPEGIEPITVAVLGTDRYLVNGHMRARALKSAGHDSARAFLVKVKSMAEIVTLHVDLNSHGAINPLGMLDAVRFLKKYGADKAIQSRYVELEKKMLYKSARSILEGFVEGACKRYGTVDLPPHVVEWIVKFEGEHDQVTATTILVDSLRHLREPAFAFPAPRDLELMFYSIKPKVAEEKEAKIFEPEQPVAWPKVEKAKASNLIKGATHDGILKCRCGQTLLVNTKTLRVSSVRDEKKNKCIRLSEEESARPVYAIPRHMLDFMQLGTADDIKFVKIKSKKELVRFVSGVEDISSLRLVVLSR